MKKMMSDKEDDECDEDDEDVEADDDVEDDDDEKDADNVYDVYEMKMREEWNDEDEEDD